jgi:hypothetical protein
VNETADAFVPLTFAPGEAYQFDSSHEIVVMDGLTTIVKVAHLRLCHSRMMFPRWSSPAGVPMKVSITNLRSTSSTQDSPLNKFDVIITYGARVETSSALSSAAMQAWRRTRKSTTCPRR